MIKRVCRKIFVALGLICLSYGQIAAVTMRQANVVLEVKNLFCTYNTIEDQKLNLTHSYCGYQGIQPVAFIVKNEGDMPVRISAQSLRAMRIPKEQLIIQDSRKDLVGISVLAGFYLGFTLGLWELIAIDHYYPRWRSSLHINPRMPIVTIGWSVIATAAFIFTWVNHGYNKHNGRQLAKLMLADEIIIQPGESVRKIAFLDAQYYNGLFTFHVLSDDKKRFVASFDVELFD